MKRIAFVTYYSEVESPEEYVIFLLKKIKPFYDTIILISNSPLSEKARTTLHRYSDQIIERQNSGYDFAAWAAGIQSVGWARLEKYDQLTLLNTTCFGPIFPLEPVYASMEQKGNDFWGMTNFRETSGIGWYPGGTIPEHIQSYFLSFAHKTFMSKTFRSFIDAISDDIPRDDVIINYETKLTGLLKKAGFSYDVIFSTIDLPVVEYIDYSRYDATACIDAGVPFVKIKAFIPENNRRNIDIVKHIEERSKYPTKLIRKYFDRHNRELIAELFHHSNTKQKIKSKLKRLLGKG